MRARLAIAIPAYGRPVVLATSIAAMAAEARTQQLDVAFYVSDDSPDDLLEAALQPVRDTGAHVFYRRNQPALGHDRNLIATLQWPNADYVWLLGDRYRASPGVLAPILTLLDDQDLLFVNVHDAQSPDVGAAIGEKGRQLLRDLLWHQTLTGATIYSAKVRNWAAMQGSNLLIVRNFPQICIMLGFASANNLTIGRFGRHALQGADPSGVSYWYSKAVDVFGRDWSEAVSSFPRVITAEHRARVTREHSKRTNLFNTYHLVTLRHDGQLRWFSLLHRGIRESMHLPLWKLLAVVALPVPLLRLGGRTLGKIKRVCSSRQPQLAKRS